MSDFAHLEKWNHRPSKGCDHARHHRSLAPRQDAREHHKLFMEYGPEADKRAEDKLVVRDSANKIIEIDSHIIASSAGILSDARILIERAQVLSQQHRVTYNSPIEPE